MAKTLKELTKSVEERYPLTTKHEGAIQTKAFEDPPNQPVPEKDKYYSIGRGTKSFKGEQITPQEADKRFEDEMKSVQSRVDSAVKVPLNAAQREAVVDYVYNAGPGQLQGSKFIEKLNAGDWEGAAKEMDIVTGGGRALPGLKDRRRDERERMVPQDEGPQPQIYKRLEDDLNTKYEKKKNDAGRSKTPGTRTKPAATWKPGNS